MDLWSTPITMATLLPAVIYGVGLLFLCYSVYSSVRSIMASQWRKTKGVLLSARLIEDADRERTSHYKIAVEYEYTVGHIPYRSTKVAFGLLPSNMKCMIAGVIAAIERQAPPLTVYYLPENTAHAVLITGLHRFHYWNLLLAFFWLVLCTYLSK